MVIVAHIREKKLLLCCLLRASLEEKKMFKNSKQWNRTQHTKSLGKMYYYDLKEYLKMLKVSIFHSV